MNKMITEKGTLEKYKSKNTVRDIERFLRMPESYKHAFDSEQGPGKSQSIDFPLEDLINNYTINLEPCLLLDHYATGHGLPNKVSLSGIMLALIQEDRIMSEYIIDLPCEMSNFVEQELNFMYQLFDSYKLLLDYFVIDTGKEFIKWLPGDTFDRKQVPKKYLKNISPKLIFKSEKYVDIDQYLDNKFILFNNDEPGLIKGMMRYLILCQYYNEFPTNEPLIFSQETEKQIEKLYSRLKNLDNFYIQNKENISFEYNQTLREGIFGNFNKSLVIETRRCKREMTKKKYSDKKEYSRDCKRILFDEEWIEECNVFDQRRLINLGMEYINSERKRRKNPLYLLKNVGAYFVNDYLKKVLSQKFV